MTTSAATDDQIADAARSILLERRAPLTIDEVVEAIRDTRPDLELGRDARQRVDAVLDDDWSVVVLPGGAVAHVLGLLAGTVLSHRLTANEIRHNLVAVDGDLRLALRLGTGHDEDDADADATTVELANGDSLMLVFPDLDDELLAGPAIPACTFPPAGAFLVDRLDLSSAQPDDVLALIVGTDAHELLLVADRPELAPLDLDDEMTARYAAAFADAHRGAARVDALEALVAYVAPEPDDLLPPVSFDELVLAARAADPELFGVGTPPITEILAAIGWELQGEWLAPSTPMTPSGAPSSTSTGSTTVAPRRADEYLSDPAGAAALQALLDAYDSYLDRPSVERPTALEPEQAARLARGFARANVAAAFTTAVLGFDVHGAIDLRGFTEQVLAAAPATGTERAASAWVLASAATRLGDPIEAERQLDQALAADPTYAPALDDAAEYASVRGDAARAIALANRAGAEPDDAYVELLRSMLPERRSDVGRNSPCPCGSGRKYKACHLGHETVTLERRARWLWQKAADFAANGPRQADLVDAARAFLAQDQADVDLVRFAFTEPLMVDLVLFEGRAIDHFLRDRGALLPDDERALAERWAGRRHSLFEVVAPTDGGRTRVRDLRTDDLIDLDESEPLESHPIGSVVLALSLPNGATHLLSARALPIPPERRDSLLDLLGAEPSYLELARALSHALIEPGYTTAEGEELVFVTIRFAVDDAEHVAAALDAEPALNGRDAADAEPDHAEPDHAAPVGELPSAFADDEDDDGNDGPVRAQWVESVVVEGQPWLRGSLTLHDDVLVLRANALARAERLRRLIDDAVPGLIVVDEQHLRPDELLEQG